MLGLNSDDAGFAHMLPAPPITSTFQPANEVNAGFSNAIQSSTETGKVPL